MEAVKALAVASPSALSLRPRAPSFARLQGNVNVKIASIRARVVATAEPSYAGEGEAKTVFPGEACDELGGEFCNAEGVGPEVKLPSSNSNQGQPLKGFLDAFKPDVGTVSYDGPKTVFPGEACDELGGEFCEPEYQKDVGKEVRQ